MDALEKSLQSCLRKHLRLVADGEPVAMSAALRDLGLDSMSVIELLLDLESTFAVTFPDAMMSPETFKTGDVLHAAVRQLVEAAGSAD